MEYERVARRLRTDHNLYLAPGAIESAVAVCTGLHDNPAVQVRPGLQLHCAALATQMARRAGDHPAARHWAAAAAALTTRCQPFDMAGSELAQILGADPPGRRSA